MNIWIKKYFNKNSYSSNRNSKYIIFRFYQNKLWSKIIFTLLYPIFKLCTKTVEEGAQTQLYLSYLDYNKIASGVYYADCKLEKISKTSQDNNLGKEFMNNTIEKICEELPRYDKEFKKYLNQWYYYLYNLH